MPLDYVNRSRVTSTDPAIAKTSEQTKVFCRMHGKIFLLKRRFKSVNTTKSPVATEGNVQRVSTNNNIIKPGPPKYGVSWIPLNNRMKRGVDLLICSAPRGVLQFVIAPPPNKIKCGHSALQNPPLCQVNLGEWMVSPRSWMLLPFCPGLFYSLGINVKTAILHAGVLLHNSWRMLYANQASLGGLWVVD